MGSNSRRLLNQSTHSRVANAAGRAANEVRFAVALHQGRRQRCAWPRAGAETRRQILGKPEHLRPRAERKTERWYDRRTLEPAAAWRGGDHVAPTVDDVEMPYRRDTRAAARMSARRRRVQPEQLILRAPASFANAALTPPAIQAATRAKRPCRPERGAHRYSRRSTASEAGSRRRPDRHKMLRDRRMQVSSIR